MICLVATTSGLATALTAGDASMGVGDGVAKVVAALRESTIGPLWAPFA